MITWLLGISPLSRILIGSLLSVAGLIALRAWDVSHQRAIGEERAVAKIEKANDKATHDGRIAAERSADRGVRGAIDPSYRD